MTSCGFSWETKGTVANGFSFCNFKILVDFVDCIRDLDLV
ncbi:hypothetical protein FOQG_04518 [Fusarium oxysporum f. sp. raphani 54005]|uniref:Uncharacterized protein n=4 Tax=Fusarium oxysporum TaxID=5507 RepID=X0DJ82_FUSOX|nr:hypothetical protein FOVG_04422 [Fusarium oxysporum f. sp. pisi HDV247]EXK94457.1 hypothetical protein FOQG_04518 [Fusarium oxysporum f. sp. raphani 54005]EXL88811.1 hypothetical protein FOPG_00362 [Fusarium oxysporum f. sp. conglutinans race 2 54008]EXM32004.1 hypothetical protein FOTG_03620 [Fusarium oxysporum f. sp. vasinfectum 25433]